VERQMRSMRRQGYTQPEREVRYWQHTSKEEAVQALRNKLSGLVLGHG
jgi:hypothetical protein